MPVQETLRPMNNQEDLDPDALLADMPTMKNHKSEMAKKSVTLVPTLAPSVSQKPSKMKSRFTKLFFSKTMNDGISSNDIT